MGGKMASMKSSEASIAHLRELVAGVPDLKMKPMFGGWGLFRQELCVGCLLRDEVYFRAEGERAERAAAAGRSQFRPEVSGRTMSMPYWSAGAEAMDGVEGFAEAVADAFADACEADARKPAGKRKLRA